MVAENIFVQVSGTITGIGSHCANMAMLVAESGAGVFVPVNLVDLK